MSSYLRYHSRHQAGLTLIEVLVALSVIATLSALLYPAVSSALRRSYVTTCQSQLKQAGQALKMYQADYQTEDWPCGLDKLFPNYISSRQILVCPWVKRMEPDMVDEYQKEFYPRAWTSYFLFCRTFLDTIAQREGRITFTEIMQMRGERTPVVICRDHREPSAPIRGRCLPPTTKCPWLFPEMPVVVLRKDGSVDLSMGGGTVALFQVRSTLEDAMRL